MILNLTEIRNRKKMTKTQLANLSKVSSSYITELENGDYKNPGVKIICSLCLALGTTPNELINKKYWS